jgi:glucoamylase
MDETANAAPGGPGTAPTWTSSAKSGVGTALTYSSRVWFTVSHGIFNEIYYPRLDQACVRDMGLIVTDGNDFFSEEKRHAKSEVSYPAEGVPAYRLVNTCKAGRYRVEKRILSDPFRDAVLQQTRFEALQGTLQDYHLYVLLAPHLGNRGSGNTAWVGDYKGVPMLFARRAGNALALACSAPWLRRSAGFVGSSDGWNDISRHNCMLWSYGRAENGNVALTGEVDLNATGGEFLLALGFGRNASEAGFRALASLRDDFDNVQAVYVSHWQKWQKSLLPLEKKESEPDARDLYRISAAVLRVHESNRFPGGTIASLSVPWGFARGDDDLGGYHLVWPRDLVETAGGLLAAGAHEDVKRVLYYLRITQESDGHWPQNMWLDGGPYWSGVQMDETAFPILLVDLARRQRALTTEDLARFWPMVRRAAGFVARNGPVTQQDRWEEDPGYSPFTLAVEVAALLAAADLADLQEDSSLATYLRELADAWNDGIEQLIYAQDTDLARKVGVEGYYVRVAPPDTADGSSSTVGFVPIKNRPPGKSRQPSSQIVSPDALALVRFGLRAPDDARIVNTVKVIDALLQVNTPTGPAWHRYNEDGYGEHEDGSPFDGTGVGRAWPLLTGERAHYELAAGRRKDALRLLHALESFANEGGMIPEQIWDSPDIPERELFFGRPSGSAMPLVWAHSEYVKLRRSLQEGRVFDMPPQAVQRYIERRTASPYSLWRFNHKCQTLPAGRRLRVEVLAPARIRWSSDEWKTSGDIETRDTGLSLHVADLDTQGLQKGKKISFTLYWPGEDRWEGSSFEVRVE